MSLRDFNAPDDRIVSLHNQPEGNGSGLGTFHTVHPEDAQSGNASKIVGGLAVALMLGAAGVGLYVTSGPSSQPKPVVIASNQPAPPPVAPVTAPPGANSLDTAAAPVDNIPPPAPAKAASAGRSHVMAGPSRATASARTPAQSEPVSAPPAVTAPPSAPAPSPSDVANNNSQSSVAVPRDATTASDIPAPQPDNAAPPAQAQPAPADQSPQQ